MKLRVKNSKVIPRSKFKVGDEIDTWFSGDASGKSRILEVRKYDGRYPKYFKYILKVTAPTTMRGWMEICR